MIGEIRIGISGWTYPPWRGVFYPDDLIQKRELAYASSTFRSIEINGTFYSMQRPSSYQKWASETPSGFVFSIKGPKFITHIRRLKMVEQPLANFFSSGLLSLGEKLGPILWQLPPSVRFEPETLEAFLQLLPHDTEQASTLARNHDEKMIGRTVTDSPVSMRVRHSIEVRNKSFAVPEFIAMLKKYNVALVCADTVAWPRMMDVTSDFMYCRLHGSEVLYASGYTEEALDKWTERAIAWARGSEPDDAEKIIDSAPPDDRARDVFLYFDNDLKVKAPFDAQSMRKRVDEALISQAT